MAENAAHLTATLHPKPSIFEVIAQDSLNSTIHPALQKIALFLSSYNPRKYTWLLDYCDEVYLLINGLIQYHYIRKYGASFSEYFYGLKRVPAFQKLTDNLSDDQQKLSLIFLVILPYLKYKLEQKLTEYRLELADNLVYSSFKRKLKQLICSLHGFTHFSWTLLTVSQYLKYMSGATDYQSPILRIMALKLTYTNVEEDTSFLSALLHGNLNLSQLSFGLLGQLMSNSLEMGAFFMQFLQYWQSEKSHIDITALPTPTPPLYDPKSEEYRGRCPLCMQHWRVATVVSVSGYVFCFRCIMRHLQESNTCPVTNLPAKVSDIVRVFDNY